MIQARGRRLTRQLCVLLFAGTAAVLQAEAADNNNYGRPLRTQRSDPPPPPAIPRYPVPDTRSFLLTPENMDQPLTRYYIERYSNTGGISWLNSIIKNASLYLPYIHEEIARRGLPPELAYLPFIESGYLSTARSKSGATGIWQFMMNSIGSMKVDDLVDERRDFRKSTGAALQKMTENYRVLGNWPLALAAYNAGLGGVSRTVKKENTSDYWLLCARKGLRHETIHYVPKFLAVSYILTHSRQFGVDYWPETVAWTTVKPEKQVSLDIIAQETGVDRPLLYRLNSELLYGITPADKNYELKVPSAQVEMIAGLLEREDTRLLRYYRYQIRYGDTLSALSRHYSVSINMIEQYNPGIINRHLRIGETVIIPAFKETMPYTGKTDSIAREQGGGFGGTHLVSKGDTLWSLAIRYQVDPQILAEENNMDLNQILSIGKVLKVPIME